MHTLEITALAVVYAAWLALLLWLITGGPERRMR
ncbi:hypothetical protein FHS31_000351 [Sphingomonas vulcanisoli]|uniref:CcmD family protein n=1 Tax=Sphingomonas vulcanisoli TaxID=1658060 RepID=A0ABX0TRK4_9SPHN|nr:hypothetical protein [Sphingomonas vulcanisoli]